MPGKGGRRKWILGIRDLKVKCWEGTGERKDRDGLGGLKNNRVRKRRRGKGRIGMRRRKLKLKA